ncbi:MAG: hypothetical protein WDA65_05040 [Christensenellales bacterium]
MEMIKQYLITPAAGKRLIAKSILYKEQIKQALKTGTVVIIAGTTNAYVAEETLDYIGQRDYSRSGFVRGITLPPSYKLTEAGRLPDEGGFAGDVVIINGKWEKGLDIFAVADSLKKGDVIIKGANAINMLSKQAGILIGHPKGGTIMAALRAVAGRRVSLYLPVGVEKRIPGDITEIANKLNLENAAGLRLLPVYGEIITELEAINIISGADAELVSAGGVCGAEGSCWIAVSGSERQIEKAKSVIEPLLNEPAYKL